MDWSLACGNKAANFTFLCYDHVRFLQQHRLVPGAAAPTGVRAMRWLAASHAAAAALHLVRLGRTTEMQQLVFALAHRLRTKVGEFWEALEALRHSGQTHLIEPPEGASRTHSLRARVSSATAAVVTAARVQVAVVRVALSLLLRDPDNAFNLKAAVKQLMLFLQAAHIGKVLQSHDLIVGFLGVTTSAWDLSALWPTRVPIRSESG